MSVIDVLTTILDDAVEHMGCPCCNQSGHLMRRVAPIKAATGALGSEMESKGRIKARYKCDSCGGQHQAVGLARVDDVFMSKLKSL